MGWGAGTGGNAMLVLAAGTGGNAMLVLAADLSQRLPGPHNTWTFALENTNTTSHVKYLQFVAAVSAVLPQGAPRRFKYVTGDVIVFMIHPRTHHLVAVPAAIIPAVEEALANHGLFLAGGCGVQSWVQPDGENLLVVDHLC